jgi:hypothetical protein
MGDKSVPSRNAVTEYNIALRKSLVAEDLSIGGLRAYMALRNIFCILLTNDSFTRQNSLISNEKHSSIKFKLDTEITREILIKTIQDVVNKKPIESVKKWFPSLTDIADDDFHTKKNLTEWTLKFAEEVLIEFDWEKFSEIILRCEGYSTCCFDLTLLHLSENTIKFVEVKFEDKFTQSQLTDISLNMLNDMNIELAIIKIRST